MKSRTLAVTAAVTLLPLSACASAQTQSSSGGSSGSSSSETIPAVHLSAYAQDPKSSNDTKGVYKFAELAKKYSHGKITMKVHPNGELGKADSAIQQMQSGSLDFADTGISYFTTSAPELSGIQLPYLFSGRKSAYKALSGPLKGHFEKQLREKNIKLLGFPEIGFRSITTKHHPVRTPHDLKGLKIRTLPDKLQVNYWKSLGAQPTPLDFNELYTALSTGTVNGQENPPTIIYSGKFYEVQNYLSMTKHVYTPALLAMSLKKWKQLPTASRSVITRAASDAIHWERNYSKTAQARAVNRLEKHGVKIIKNPDITKFKSASKPVYKQWKAKHGNKLIKLAHNK
jgi:tripartite ATP-independent transporter DctP family solute receptor